MKILFRYLFAVLILLFIGFLVSNYFFSKNIKTLLAEENSLSYSELTVNSFTGNLSLKQVRFEDHSKQIAAEELNLNVSLLSYLVHKEVKIERIDVEKLDIKLINSSDLTATEQPELDTVNIDKLNLNNAQITYTENDTNVFKISNLNVKAENLTWPLNKDFEWLKQKSLTVDGQNMRFDLDDLHHLSSEKIEFENQAVSFTNFSVQPKYSTLEYINHIDTEKDLMDLKSKSLIISGLECFRKDSLLHILSKKIVIDTTDFNIYRDKTIADDTTFKPLYSQSLRELDFKFSIDSVLMSDLTLSYQELLEKKRKPAEIKFNSIQAQVSNLHNHLDTEKPEIVVQAKARFTENSEIDFQYQLVPDHEQFYVSTQLKQVEDKSINSFLGSAMSMELDGAINTIETSLEGNNSEINGDFSIAYKKLKLNILKKDGSRNNFASLMSNALIRNRDVDETHDIEKVKRDSKKSLWNYIWTFHLEGLKKTLI